MPSPSECKRKFANRIGALRRLENHLERPLTKEERTLFEKSFNMGWKFHKKEVGHFKAIVLRKSQQKQEECKTLENIKETTKNE